MLKALPFFLDITNLRTKQEIQGYFRTGDLVEIVDKDLVRCAGRVKDLVIRGGRKISPDEAEDILLTHSIPKNVVVASEKEIAPYFKTLGKYDRKGLR